jgi:hypothetical protein
MFGWRAQAPRKGDLAMRVNKPIAAAAFLLGAMSAALAQSAYTTGTIASSEGAGYHPSSSGYGTGLYDYAANYLHSRAYEGRRPFH